MKNTKLVLGFILIILLVTGGSLFAQGYCLDFNGFNQAVIASTFRDDANITGQVTVEAWVYADSRPEWASIAKNWGPGFWDYGLFHFGLLNDGRLQCAIRQTNNTAKDLADNVVLPLGSWQHVAFVADGSNLFLYRNGNLVSGPVAYNGTLHQGWNPLAIGAKPNVDGTVTYHHWDGKIDEVRFWDYGRSQAEIQDNMENSLMGNESGLVAYYKFNEGTGSTAYDSAGDIDGDLFNTPTWTISDAPLPVTLSSFTASFSEGYSLLSWTTQSESNNLGWNIYRSEIADPEDALQVNSILIPGAGTSTQPTEYIFNDVYEVTANTEYWYWLESISYNGETNIFGPVTLTIQFENNQISLPTESVLRENYPNPFNPETTISFSIKENEEGTLSIYNLKGQQIFIEYFETGEYQFKWNATQYGSGIYFYKLDTQSYIEIKKMIMMK